ALSQDRQRLAFAARDEPAHGGLVRRFVKGRVGEIHLARQRERFSFFQQCFGLWVAGEPLNLVLVHGVADGSSADGDGQCRHQHSCEHSPQGEARSLHGMLQSAQNVVTHWTMVLARPAPSFGSTKALIIAVPSLPKSSRYRATHVPTGSAL